MSDICIDNGWILTEEDLVSPTQCGVDKSGEKPAIKSKADGVRRAKAKVNALMNRSRNTLVAATKLICDVDVIRCIAILLHGSKGVDLVQWALRDFDVISGNASTLPVLGPIGLAGWVGGDTLMSH